MEDVKNTAASILKTLGPGGPTEADADMGANDSDDGGDVGLQAAGEDIMSAFHSKDTGALVDGLKAFFQLMRDE